MRQHSPGRKKQLPTRKKKARPARQRETGRKTQLLLSSTFTAEEAHRTAVWLNSPGATCEKASGLIDQALDRINARNTSRKASEDRKAAYQAEKAEHPPKRFNQDYPPTQSFVRISNFSGIKTIDGEFVRPNERAKK